MKKNIVIIILVLVVGALSYYSYKQFNANKDLENKLNQPVKEDTQQIQDNNDKVVNKLINFDKTKCINGSFNDDNIEIIKEMSVEINGLNLSIDLNDKKNVFVQARYDLIHPEKYSDEDIRNNTVKYRDELNLTFSKNVESIYGGLFGMSEDDSVFLFLMEDGTVEYMKFIDIYNNEKYDHKPIDGVTDIVKFENIIYGYKNETGSSSTALAYKIDGTYYDLGKYIK